MRRLVKMFLNRYGYDIIKTERFQARKGTKERKIMVGNFMIGMPQNNIQLVNYKIQPGLNMEIGRLASAVHKKYPGMTAIDIGANTGDTISIIRSAVDCPVIGIEGDDVSYNFLERNVKQFKNVSIEKVFLGERSEKMNVHMGSEGWNNTIIPTKSEGKEVSFRTLNEVIAEKYAMHDIKFVKLDIEGYDTIALRGAQNVITQHKPVIIFEYNRDVMNVIREDGLSTLLSFKTIGYNKVIFFDHLGRMLLSTFLHNEAEIIDLHNYGIGKGNLLGYYDICLFHSNDDDIAADFTKAEKECL